MIKLSIHDLVDFSELSINDIVVIEIFNTNYKFSPDAELCGKDERHFPIFGSKVYINDVLKITISYGLPPLLFPQGSAPLIKFINNTKFTTNLHFHGLINTGLVDGASSFEIFGPSTYIGNTISIQLPIIRNNSALTWYHAHPMFRSVELALAGLIGTVLVTDKISQPLNNLFTYGDNHIVLTCTDIDLQENGCPTFGNITVDVNRSCFTMINGISSVQWYTDPNESVPYSNINYHNTNENIVKIDILNSNGNWRVFYLGVCDSEKNIVPFYVIQTDQGLCAPVNTTIQFIPVGGRISILVDLTIIKSAYLFFYDYDLTENLGINDDGSGTFPDFTNNSSTPYPSPILDPDNINQQENPTNINYPTIALIPQVNQFMVNGLYPIPKTNSKRPFLYINNVSENNKNNISIINTILPIINNIIYKNGIPPIDSNYLSSLNPNYFYNIPNVTPETPIRNIVLWGETDINYINGESGNAYIVDKDGKNGYGVSECCNGTNRIYVDLWNSAELNLDEALIEYSKSPNNYKPKVLPTSEFRVTQTDDNYINIAMISNDKFTIQGFENNISYGENTQKPIFSVLVNLPATPQRVNLNIQEWVDLLNYNLSKTNITINGETMKSSKILSFDWSFFPYGVNLLDGTTKYFKSAIIKTKNNSNYHIRILGRWAILQLMGKSMAGIKNLTPPKPKSGPCCSVNEPCDEEYLYGVYDNYIQEWYPYYSTDDENIQNPILCPRRNAQLIISPNQTYIGLYDGYFNDNLRSFSTKLKSTEIWTYLNADTGDSHPLHFHLTSGYSYPSLTPINSKPESVGSDTRLGLTQTYSRDIMQIGPQESLSFALTWPYYSSDETTSTPYVPNIGASIHCHFFPHIDSNSMFMSYSVKPLSNIVSDICFPSGTLIKTDQGDIPIETLIPNIHTISNKKIMDITKTVSLDDYLVCFEKNSLADNIPSKKTYLSKFHKLFYKGKAKEAFKFIKKFDNVYKVKYDGEMLYNVLMENHDKMIVNNLICETLDPDSNIAKIYKYLNKLNYDEYENLINKHNSYCIKKNILTK